MPSMRRATDPVPALLILAAPVVAATVVLV